MSGLQRFEALIASAVLAVGALGLALLPVTSSVCVRALVTAVDSAAITGISEGATFDAAEAVRVFVLDPDAPPLPSTIESVPAFDDAAVSHLVDVRNVIVPARTLALVLGVLAAAWIAVRVRTATGRRIAGAGLRGAGVALGILAALAVLAGFLDFDSLFTWFHGLFFEAGTWMFPASALLIRVFPTPFWVSAGALWGVLVLMCGGVMLIAGRRLGFTQGNYSV